MMNKRSLLKATVVAVAVAWSGTTLAQDKPIKVGVTAGPHAQIFEQVKKVAARDGLKAICVRVQNAPCKPGGKF